MKPVLKKKKSDKNLKNTKSQKKCNPIKKPKRKYKRFQYTEESLKEAVDKVRAKVLSANKASLEYKIPKGTLINKLCDENEPTIGRMGPPTTLTLEEESRIKKWIIDKARIGYPMHPNIVKNAIKNVLDKAPRSNCFKNNMPGEKWFKLFLKRHPKIALKNTEVLSKSRAAVTEQNIRQWFADVTAYLEKENACDILNDPSRIFNMDETGIQLCPKTGKLLGPKKEKNMYLISPGQEKESITVLCTYSANGRGICPMIVYPYKRFPPKEVAGSVPDGYIIGHSPSGWMTRETFNNFIKNGFYRQLVKDGIKFPVLLLFDGHKSHISLELHDFCVANRILLYCLYPNATHIMQPCDVGIFRPLKKCWQKQVAEHAQLSSKPITKANFAPLFNAAYINACDPQVIKKSFECCGLYPFSPDKIDYSKCISHRRKLMNQSNFLDVVNEDTTRKDVTLLNIESRIPQNVLHEFEIAYKVHELPKTEIILFNIWKEFKDASPNLIDNNLKDNEEDHSDKHSLNTEMAILESNQNVLVIENNVSNDDVKDLSSDENITEILIRTTPLNSVKSQNLLMEDHELMVASGLECSTANSEGCVNASILSMNVLDLTQEEYQLLENNENNKHMVISDANVKQAYSEPVNLLLEESSFQNSLLCTQEIINIDKVWEHELHFPRIETSKKQKDRNIKPKVYAISSEEWKKQYEEKLKEQEEQQNQKELQKLEREAKKKVKQEEQETKKKEREAEKELKLKKRAEMQIKKKEKEAKRELLQKRKTDPLNLQNNAANIAYTKRRRVLKNITNSSIIA